MEAYKLKGEYVSISDCGFHYSRVFSKLILDSVLRSKVTSWWNTSPHPYLILLTGLILVSWSIQTT